MVNNSSSMLPICTKPVLSRKIQFINIEQKPYVVNFFKADYNINIFILYIRHKRFNKETLEGCYWKPLKGAIGAKETLEGCYWKPLKGAIGAKETLEGCYWNP